MSLKVGERAPDIRATTTDGEPFVLSEGQEVCTVLFFFPRAFSSGCTREVELFAKDYTELYLAGARLVGVSTDDPKTQCDFAAKLGIPFPLIADEDRSIANAYEAYRSVLRIAKRITYIIGEDQRIMASFHHEIGVERHRNAVLRFVKDLVDGNRAEARTTPAVG